MMEQKGVLEFCPQDPLSEHFDLKKKLQTILATAVQESEEVQELYTHKISQLYDQIASKDSRIFNLQEQLKFMRKKCYNLLEELTSKQRLIDRLNQVIEIQTKKIKTGLHNYIQSFDFSVNVSSTKEVSQKVKKEKGSWMNISDYYSKVVQKSRELTRCDYDASGETSSFSTLYPSVNDHCYIKNVKSPQALGRVKSMKEKKFFHHASNLLPREQNDQSPKHSRKETKSRKKKYIGDLLKTQKNHKWKNLSNFPKKHYQSPMSKFLFS